MKSSVGFIAVGQAGGNIGLLLDKLGYNVLFLGTSKEDLNTLTTNGNNIDSCQIHHIKDGEGCRRIRNKAKDLTIADFDAIARKIEEQFEDNQYIFVIFGSGGGTGSGASPMLIDKLIHDMGKKAGAITILPGEGETLRTAINTYDCFAELEDINDMCATFILDNNHGEKLTINQAFVDGLHAFLEIPNNWDVRGNIDKAEIKEMLETRGAAIISLMDAESSSTQRLLRSIQENIYAPLEKDKVIKYIGISASTEIDMDAVMAEVGSCLDIFQSTNKKHTVCMLCGLMYPYAVLEKVWGRVESSKEGVTKNIKETHNRKLNSGVDFLASGDLGIGKSAQPQSIFEKYKRPTKAPVVELSAYHQG